MLTSASANCTYVHHKGPVCSYLQDFLQIEDLHSLTLPKGGEGKAECLLCFSKARTYKQNITLQVGLEPTTNRLTVDRSTTELLELTSYKYYITFVISRFCICSFFTNITWLFFFCKAKKAISFSLLLLKAKICTCKAKTKPGMCVALSI